MRGMWQGAPSALQQPATPSAVTIAGTMLRSVPSMARTVGLCGLACSCGGSRNEPSARLGMAPGDPKAAADLRSDTGDTLTGSLHRLSSPTELLPRPALSTPGMPAAGLSVMTDAAEFCVPQELCDRR